jgi:hypothetical protein
MEGKTDANYKKVLELTRVASKDDTRYALNGVRI